MKHDIDKLRKDIDAVLTMERRWRDRLKALAPTEDNQPDKTRSTAIVRGLTKAREEMMKIDTDSNRQGEVTG